MPWVTSATGVADEVRPATGGKRTAYAAPVTTESRRKLSVFAPLLLALLSSVGPFAIDTAFPAFPQMGRDLAVGGPALQWTISAYLFAFGVMSIFHGPLSDALGRRPVIIGGMALFALASVGCALAPSLPMLLFFRVLQGLSAGGGVIVSRTVIRDVYEGSDAQRLMSRVTMIFALAPAIALSTVRSTIGRSETIAVYASRTANASPTSTATHVHDTPIASIALAPSEKPIDAIAITTETA